MAYTKNTWASGDKITSAKMNHLEQGVADSQPALVSGTNIKTINGTSLLGSGNIVISGGGGGETELYPMNLTLTGDIWTADKTFTEVQTAYQNRKLVVFQGEMEMFGATFDIIFAANIFVPNAYIIANMVVEDGSGTMIFGELIYAADGHIEIWNQVLQEKLTSGTNIKTINGNSLLGSGNIEISGGGGGAVSSVNGKTGTVVLSASDVGALPSSTTVPTQLSQLTADSTHRTVTDTEKSTWNGKQSAISDLSTIRSGASAGATAVQPGSLASVATSGSYNDLSNKPSIPSAVTESTVSGWGFTKNTGTYSKPSTGIPKTDLASAVQTSLGKADSAYQKPSSGIPKTDLASVVQTSLGKADSAVQSVKTVNGITMTGSGDVSTLGKITSFNSNEVQLNNNETKYHTGKPTTLHVTLSAPTEGVDCITSVIFKAGASLNYWHTSPSGYYTKWDGGDEPTWTTGHIYEIVFRCLWRSNQIVAKYAEVTT